MEPTKTFKIKKSQLIIPALIGIVVVGLLFSKEIKQSGGFDFHLNADSLSYIALALLFMAGRDLGMIARFRMMTSKQLNWHRSFIIHILNEFTSSVTPSAVGGSGLVAVYMTREGINGGKSAAVTVANLFLDEMFFITICPLVVFLIPFKELFGPESAFSSTLVITFWSVYALIAIYTFLLYFGLFVHPHLINRFLQKVFRFPLLRRWENTIISFGENLIEASHELTHKSIFFWLKAYALTVISWSSRFLVANALFLIFIPLNNHFMIYGRQLVLWIFMVVSPTPGGSGMSEFAFREYFNDIDVSGSDILIIIILWRIFNFYIYLFIGMILMPRWIKKTIH